MRLKRLEIILEDAEGWHLTACGIGTPNGEPAAEQPKRICRECREALKPSLSGEKS